VARLLIACEELAPCIRVLWSTFPLRATTTSAITEFVAGKPMIGGDPLVSSFSSQLPEVIFAPWKQVKQDIDMSAVVTCSSAVRAPAQTRIMCGTSNAYRFTGLGLVTLLFADTAYVDFLSLRLSIL
jgi:hypothetical protein